LTRASRSSVFSLDFFHSLAGLGCGEDGGDDSGADPSASLRALFFLAPVFELLEETPSSSKCRVFSLAFARGLCWWRMVAARLDLLSRTMAVVAEAV
jgi:hypothetical protein